MRVTKQLMVAIDLHTVAWQIILLESMATVNSLVTSIILFCVQQKKETHAGLGWLNQLYGD